MYPSPATTATAEGSAIEETNAPLARLRSWAERSPLSGWLLAVLLTLPALVPLMRAGFFVSDDGLFHVYRIAALADAWQHGVLYPRLFPQFGFGYGQAVLNFYAPLSYAPGAFLALTGMSPCSRNRVEHCARLHPGRVGCVRNGELPVGTGRRAAHRSRSTPTFPTTWPTPTSAARCPSTWRSYFRR